MLYTRESGKGPPIIVLHGGPDFDHSYLLPDLDRLASTYRLICYDQRGRGRSAAGVKPEDVTLESEMQDLDAVRRKYGLERVAIRKPSPRTTGSISSPPSHITTVTKK